MSRAGRRGEKFKTEVIAGLHRGAGFFLTEKKYSGALELMVYEQQLSRWFPATFYARLGNL